MLAGWFGLAVLVIRNRSAKRLPTRSRKRSRIASSDRDCGNVLGAFFNRAVWLSRRVPRPRTAVEQDMSRPRKRTAAVVSRLRTSISLLLPSSGGQYPKAEKALPGGEVIAVVKVRITVARRGTLAGEK